jgi:hypothetical protein
MKFALFTIAALASTASAEFHLRALKRPSFTQECSGCLFRGGYIIPAVDGYCEPELACILVDSTPTPTPAPVPTPDIPTPVPTLAPVTTPAHLRALKRPGFMQECGGCLFRGGYIVPALDGYCEPELYCIPMDSMPTPAPVPTPDIPTTVPTPAPVTTPTLAAVTTPTPAPVTTPTPAPVGPCSFCMDRSGATVPATNGVCEIWACIP